MSETGFETELLGFLDQAIRRTKKQADQAMAQFVVLRLALVASSASLLALTTLQNRGWSTTADAVLVAMGRGVAPL